MAADVSAGRVLVLAPHPDDEAIGAGGLIQRAIARGGEVRVVFVTAGESNPWPQRVAYRRWKITTTQRDAWGAMRCAEATASLRTLGLTPECGIFLRHPDAQIAAMARRGDPTIAGELRTIMREFRPTLLVTTSAQDLHADHRAVAYFAHQAVRGLGESAPEIVTYIVHGQGDGSRLHFALDLSEREQRRKREAIGCHRSQLQLSKRRFLGYACPVEEFFEPEFDLVCTESRTRVRVGAFRHSCRVMFGRAAREVRRKTEPEPQMR